MQNHVQHPILFTIKMVGIWKTILGIITQIYKAYQKRH
ncbi:putative membrane protein [Bacteroides fragilis str. 3397 T10]|nr:putative membrane protein [Bacteroides fragilis str. 3397 T10]